MIEIIQRSFPEPLYLQRDCTNEIFINDCRRLKQHQINGLRFLFKQYKKKKNGVIVNFPSHCGKTVTAVLFLHAVKNLLKKPVLILCKHVDEVDIWKEYFSKWTDFNEDDIVIESPKVLKGKKIFIKQVDGLGSYQHHSWSIVVVKDDLINKEMCQITDADYKIWLTSTDMKKDLVTLAFIYKWIYPKLELNLKDFTPSTQTPKELLIKSIYLDTFLEDFVIRENDIKQFDTTKKPITSNAVTNQNTENKLKKSRKNKDATGTKIKRSRRIIEEDDEIINNTGVTTSDNHANNEFVVNERDERNEIKVNKIANNDSNIDGKSIIPDTSEYHRQYLDKKLSTDNIETSHIETEMEVDSTEQINFGDAINEIVKNENIQTENSTESLDSNCNANDISIILENNKETMDVEENVENKHEIANNSISIIQSEENVNVIEEKCMDVVDNVEKTSEFDTRNGSVKCHNTIDTKLSELEERTLKKFKGSFLDSIF